MHRIFLQWQFFSLKEKVILVMLFGLALFNLLGAWYTYNQEFTREEPAKGGTLRVGVVGVADSINPLFARQGGRIISELLYRSLLRYNEKGELVGDLAEKVEIQDQKVRLLLKKDVLWSDGSPVTSQDVLYTLELVQSRELHSSEFVNWLGVKIQKITDRELVLELPERYYPFWERLTIKILPYKVFSALPSSSLSSVIDPSLYRVTSGPFLLQDIKTEDGALKTVFLQRNPFYFDKAYPEKIEITFYDSQEEAIKAWKEKKVDIVLGEERISEESVPLYLPRYLVLFLNTQKSFLKERWFRKALLLGLNKQEILERLGIEGKIVDLPDGSQRENSFSLEKALSLFQENNIKIKPEGALFILNLEFKEIKGYLKRGSKGEEVKSLQTCLWALGFLEKEPDGLFDITTEKAVKSFQEKYSSEVLEPYGLKEGTGEVGPATRKKLNQVCQEATKREEPLQFTLVTPQEPLLEKVAKEIQENWGKNLGIKIEILSLPLETIEKDILTERNYDMLLLGQEVGAIGDYFAFWHSSRIYDPGLNLSLWKNREADKVLEKMRQVETKEEYLRYLEDFQTIFQEEVPAILLFSPPYFITIRDKIKGCHLQEPVSLPQVYRSLSICYLKTKKVYQLPRWRNW